jgi:NAD(P)-dependent dehydrogenase (short-subunit alcohol dehydrogenase family)
MPNYTGKVALITGANSGFGYETAAQLTEAGYDKVILACRTHAKANAARQELLVRTGRDVFESLAIDTAEPISAAAAAEDLVQRGRRIDLLVLNAGMGARDLTTNSDGVDLVYASTLVGHHVLTARLLNEDLLAPDARIVIAGSEAARSDLPGMSMTVEDFRALADASRGGDLPAAMVTATRGDTPGPYNVNNAYATAKAMVAWWAAALSRRLPGGMAVFSVSPGAAPATGFARNMPWLMRAVMMPMMRLLGPVFGISGSIEDGARRYSDAATWDADDSGSFLASPPGKMVGPMLRQETDYLLDEELQEAAWSAIVAISRGDDVIEQLPQDQVATA